MILWVFRRPRLLRLAFLTVWRRWDKFVQTWGRKSVLMNSNGQWKVGWVIFCHGGQRMGGYVFTEELLELAPFAEVVATGPEDPIKNRQCFSCLIHRKIISMKSRGLYELKRHFQRERHLRANEWFRARYHSSRVRGSDGRTLYGTKLEAKKELILHLDVTDLDPKRPIYHEVIKGKPFTVTSESSRVLTQIELLMIFLKRGDQLWTLEEY